MDRNHSAEQVELGLGTSEKRLLKRALCVIGSFIDSEDARQAANLTNLRMVELARS